MLKTTVQLLDSYDLRSVPELREYVRSRDTPCEPIEYLSSYEGWCCLQPECRFRSRDLDKLKAHMPSVHKISATDHKTSPLWEKCKLQTCFTAKGLIDYFVVIDSNPAERTSHMVENGPRLTNSETAYFEKVEQDYKGIKQEIARQAGIVHDFEDSRSARVPWLERVGFPAHLKDLQDQEIYSSYRVPLDRVLKDEASDDPILMRIIKATRVLLQDAYELCSDTSPERKMTHQRACILNEFYAGAAGKSDAFRYRKMESSLSQYFTTWVQLVVFYYRVVYSKGGHFTETVPFQQLPQHIIQPTDYQQDTMEKVITLATETRDEDNEVALQQALRRFFFSLVCHIVGSTPFQSPVLSFCAMLGRSIKMARVVEGRDVELKGQWKEPGVYSSHLSALTWTAQLLIFDYACFQEQNDENQIPVFLAKICKKFFQQLAETPFGHILQWRLYLFQTSRRQLAKRQARWSLDKQTVGYRGTEVHMTHIPELVRSDYEQAYSILYEDLLFGAGSLTPVQSWKVKDDLDMQDFRESWLSNTGNFELLKGSELALLQHIQQNPKLRSMFLLQSPNGTIRFDPKAIDIYESKVQVFLQRLLVSCHIAAGQPLREPEFLSILWCNTSRQRHVMIWEKLVMIFTQYHKGQQQSGVYKDNIRFLPVELGDLLLQFLACVQPLRQIFLQQQKPKALLSPYLWATLDGKVWPDGTLSSCLKRACTRAKIGQMNTMIWRHMSAAICKEKFSARDNSNFSSEDVIVEDIDDELDLSILALQSNHSFATFNGTYAGSTMLTMDTLLHRNHRASKLWQDLFRFDVVMRGKRERAASDVLSTRMADDLKRSQQRKKAIYSESDLLLVAQRICHRPDLQFRVPGQRAGMLSVLGSQRAEQVVIVLATGSGKTLIIMVGVSVADARTTILVLPLVALRNDLIGKFQDAGIQPLLWTPSTRRTASLVLVSVEAVCSERFLEYSQGLVMRQQLDRIIIDECHLTITASDYRDSMKQLGWYLGQVKTQSIWLTATLPPSMQGEFVQQNKLVRPRIVRESTNRRNIKYIVRREDRDLLKCTAHLIRKFWPTPYFDQSRDKIIVYCKTREEASTLGEMLDCRVYTSESGSHVEKADLIRDWLSNANQPAIVATSALGPGFDYPHIRWVIHAGAPGRLTDFSQASGRAGRAGQAATSIVYVSNTWKPSTDAPLSADHAAMELYLSSRYCYRGILSQFLDTARHWRWCMGEDAACGVCRRPHVDARPQGLEYVLQEQPQTTHSGLEETLRQDYTQDQELEQYEHSLEVMRQVCLYCRAMGRSFEHTASSCSRRWDWIRAKRDVLEACEKSGREWMADYVACWKCFQPQNICRASDPGHEQSECQYRDAVLPLCYGAFVRPNGRAWIHQHFGQDFSTVQGYLIWLGGSARFGGEKCVQAICVAAKALSEFG